MRIQIKQDKDAWVVYVNGKVHPKGTGFPTQQAAEEWVEREKRGAIYYLGNYTGHTIEWVDDETP